MVRLASTDCKARKIIILERDVSEPAVYRSHLEGIVSPVSVIQGLSLAWPNGLCMLNTSISSALFPKDADSQFLVKKCW